MSDEVREYVGLALAWYQADMMRPETTDWRIQRREHQTMALAEVLRLLDGDTRTLEQLRATGLVPLTLDDLPWRLGGVPADV